MSNKQSSVVDWLLNDYINKGVITIEAIEQAKEIEKQQIIDAYNTSFLLRDKPYETADKYYKETYGE